MSKEITKATTNELAVPAGVEDFFNSFDANAAEEVMPVSKIGLGMLTHVTVPAGGTPIFMVDEEAVKEIVGIVTSVDSTRTMFPPNSKPGDESKPLCSAVKLDGVWNGVGIPGGNCLECAMAEFGSAGKGCACSERRELFIITENNPTIPLRLSLAPTSLANWNTYMTKLRMRSKNLWAVWTSFTIQIKNGANGSYGVIVPTLKKELSKEDIAEYGDTIMKLKDMHLPQPKPLEDVFED